MVLIRGLVLKNCSEVNILLNKKNLSSSKLRKDAFDIIESGYRAIDIEPFIKNNIKFSNNVFSFVSNNKTQKINLKNIKRVFVVGFGKGSYVAVSSITRLLGKRAFESYAIDVKGSPVPSKKNKKVNVFYGTHPKPSINNVRATKKIVELVKRANKDDFIIYFIAGGGSSLLCGSSDERKYCSSVFDVLTKSGAPIQDLNTVRKHISNIKGGWLAYHSYPAKSLSLIASDVYGNDLSIIASGPTVFDKTTKKDAERILKKYKISSKFVKLEETPKDKKYFYNAKSFLFVSNMDILSAMNKKAIDLGYDSKIVSTSYSGEAKDVLSPLVKKIKKGSVLLAGGEATVTLKKRFGKGGRNQESVLGVLSDSYNTKINLSGTFASSFASDGYDNTPISGAFADSKVMKISLDKNVNIDLYLKEHNSYAFFKKIGSFFEVKRCSFNVSDIMIVIK